MCVLSCFSGFFFLVLDFESNWIPVIINVRHNKLCKSWSWMRSEYFLRSLSTLSGRDTSLCRPNSCINVFISNTAVLIWRATSHPSTAVQSLNSFNINNNNKKQTNNALPYWWEYETLKSLKCDWSCIFSSNDKESARHQTYGREKTRPIKHGYPNMISFAVLNN